MAKRKIKNTEFDHFSDDDETPADRADATYEGTTAAFFGQFQDALSHPPVRAEYLDIFAIYPDPAQPRRTVPSSVRQDWTGEPRRVPSLMQTWLAQVQAERGTPFDVDGYFLNDEEFDDGTDEGPEIPPGPVEEAFLRLVELAVSIRRDGLANPITVAQRGDDGYVIETGERRWLAYHLLNRLFTGENWDKIPARVMTETSVWRQAGENNARDNLNAVARARQFALLLMDLLRASRGVSFRPITEFAREQDFYAQVADAKTFRVPSGRNELLMAAMGVNSRSALSRCRSILTLPDEAWRLADDYNVSEETLSQLATLSPDEAVDAIHKIVLGQNNLPRVARAPASTGALDLAPGTRRHFSEMTRAITHTGRGKDEINRAALRQIQEMRYWLEEQENRIRKFLQ